MTMQHLISFVIFVLIIKDSPTDIYWWYEDMIPALKLSSVMLMVME